MTAKSRSLYSFNVGDTVQTETGKRLTITSFNKETVTLTDDKGEEYQAHPLYYVYEDSDKPKLTIAHLQEMAEQEGWDGPDHW